MLHFISSLFHLFIIRRRNTSIREPQDQTIGNATNPTSNNPTYQPDVETNHQNSDNLYHDVQAQAAHEYAYVETNNQVQQDDNEYAYADTNQLTRPKGQTGDPEKNPYPHAETSGQGNSSESVKESSQEGWMANTIYVTSDGVNAPDSETQEGWAENMIYGD